MRNAVRPNLALVVFTNTPVAPTRWFDTCVACARCEPRNRGPINGAHRSVGPFRHRCEGPRHRKARTLYRLPFDHQQACRFARREGRRGAAIGVTNVAVATICFRDIAPLLSSDRRCGAFVFCTPWHNGYSQGIQADDGVSSPHSSFISGTTRRSISGGCMARVWTFVAALMLAGWIAPAYAQRTTGEISGKVVDESGGTLPGVTRDAARRGCAWSAVGRHVRNRRLPVSGAACRALRPRVHARGLSAPRSTRPCAWPSGRPRPRMSR